MTSPIPIVGSTNSSGASTAASTGVQNTPSNTLGPNSFITLLTAQLQAQDPLSPMDPDQMVNELTSINTLQQLVQIRSDMDTLVSTLQGGQGGGASGGSAGGGTGQSGAAASAALHSAAKSFPQANFNSKFI